MLFEKEGTLHLTKPRRVVKFTIAETIEVINIQVALPAKIQTLLDRTLTFTSTRQNTKNSYVASCQQHAEYMF